MPDESGVYAAVPVELLFKRKDHQGLGDIFSKKFDPSLAPCPELRAHVVDDGNAALMHLARNPPVECRGINDDGEVGLATVGFSYEFAKQAVDFRQVTEDFGDTDNGEVLRVHDGVTPGLAHALPADAEELEVRRAAAQ